MFSSCSSNINSTSVSPFQPYFPLSSSNYHPPPPPPPPLPCVNQEPCSGDIFLHHNIQGYPISGQFPLHNNALMAPPLPQSLTHLGVSSNTVPPSINADDHHPYHSYYGAINNGNIFPHFLHSSREDIVAPPMKKDRHSKIFTAQGLRDRRVRLSINVARQFFDLQDLLGFEKASKTLEWLLTKSRKAIKQLGTRNKHLTCSTSTGRSKSLTSSSECDDDDVDSDTNEVENVASKEKEVMLMMKKKMKESESANVYGMKDSRAKARARARERTREKLMCTTRSGPQMLNQLKLFNELDHHQSNNNCETMSSSSAKANIGDHPENQELGSLLANQLAHHHEEDPSVHVIKRNKLKQYSSGYSNYNQQKYLNVVSAESTDQSSNSHIQFPNAFQNWDTNGSFPCPNIHCAITSINLSTGIYLYIVQKYKPFYSF